MSIQFNFNTLNSTVIQKDNSQFFLNLSSNPSIPNLTYTVGNNSTPYIFSQIYFYRKPSSVSSSDISINFDSVMIISFISTDKSNKDLFGIIVPLKVDATSDPSSVVNTILNTTVNNSVLVDVPDILGNSQDFYFTTYSNKVNYNIIIMKKAVNISSQLNIPLSPLTSSPFPLSGLQDITISNVPLNNTISKGKSNKKSNSVVVDSSQLNSDQYLECDAIIDNEQIEKAEFINLPVNYDTQAKQSEFVTIIFNFFLFTLTMVITYFFSPVIYAYFVIRCLHNIEGEGKQFTRIVSTELLITFIVLIISFSFFLGGYFSSAVGSSQYTYYLFSVIIGLIYFTSFCTIYIKKYQENDNFLGLGDNFFKSQKPYISVLGSAFYDMFDFEEGKGFFYALRA